MRIALALAAMMLSACNPFESKFTLTCEEAVKERLRSPSGYARIKVERRDRTLSREEYEEYLKSKRASEEELKFKLQAFDEGRYKPTVLRAYLNYDAPNAYGTPVRDLSLCEYFSDTGTADHSIPLLVKIDGKTKVDWLLEQVR